MDAQERIDNENRVFWDELCGTQLARARGITGRDQSALTAFDKAYLELYPYLLRQVPVDQFNGLRVLEVGLGYGTLGQQIASNCASYSGLDIAQGPVDMMNHRLEMIGRSTDKAVQGSVLDCPFPDLSFDVVVSIGCFHHTGNLQRCIDEALRVLRPGGRAYVMVYNKYSYRNWLRWPLSTLASYFAEGSGALRTGQRAAYDANLEGVAAPETVFSSIPELREIFRSYKSFAASLENWGGPVRPAMLPTLAKTLGLDVYVSATK